MVVAAMERPTWEPAEDGAIPCAARSSSQQQRPCGRERSWSTGSGSGGAGRSRRVRRHGADATRGRRADECDWEWRMTGGAQLSVEKIEAHFTQAAGVEAHI